MPQNDIACAAWRKIYRRARLNRRSVPNGHRLTIIDDAARLLGLSSVRFAVQPGVFHVIQRRGQLPRVCNS